MVQYFGTPPALDVNRMLEDAARIHKASKRQVHGDERYPTQTRPIARGSLQRGRLVFSLVLDEEMADAIYKLADKGNVSFAEQARLLIQWGLEADIDALLK